MKEIEDKVELYRSRFDIDLPLADGSSYHYDVGEAFYIDWNITKIVRMQTANSGVYVLDTVEGGFMTMPVQCNSKLELDVRFEKIEEP